MKYIRTQSGSVVSVSQLLLPGKGRLKDQEIWRLAAITMDSQRHTYAVYEDKNAAFESYRFVVAFMRSSYSLLEFPLIDGVLVVDSDEFWPVVYKDRNEGLDDAYVATAVVQEEEDAG